jgi:hypothetical protein
LLTITLAAGTLTEELNRRLERPIDETHQRTGMDPRPPERE